MMASSQEIDFIYQTIMNGTDTAIRLGVLSQHPGKYDTLRIR